MTQLKLIITGKCAVYGESHFKTFDGTHFDFKGVCEYNLVSRSDGSLRVTIEKKYCEYGGPFCYMHVKVLAPADGSGHKIHLTKGMDVHVDGSPMVGESYNIDGIAIKIHGSLWISVGIKDLGFYLVFDGGKLHQFRKLSYTITIYCNK